MERKNLHGNLLSSFQMRRQLALLRQHDARQAQALFTAICRPLIYAPCSGVLLLNRTVEDVSLQQMTRKLSEALRHVDLRMLTWREWRLLYLYDGQRVCLLSLACYAGL